MKSGTPPNYRGLAPQNLNHWGNYHFTCGNLGMFGPEALGCYHPKNSGEYLLIAVNPTPIHSHTVLASDRDGMLWSPMWSVLALWENSMNSTKLARPLRNDGATWPFSFLLPLEQGTDRGCVCKGWIFRERKNTSCKN